MTKMMTLAAIAALITAPLAMAQGGPNTAPQGGPNGSSQGGKPPADPEKCRKLEPTIRKQAEACLKIKKPEERGKCFEKIGKTVEPTGCGPLFEPLKQEIMAKEKAMYPDQPGMVEGDKGSQGGPNNGPQGGPNNGPQGGQQGGSNNGPQGGPNGGQPPADPAKCKKMEPTIRKQAEACLKIKKHEARSQCFEKIGKTVGPSGCGPSFEPLKQEIMAKEKQMYPDQPSAIEGDKGSQGGPNGGQNGGQNNGPQGGKPPVDPAKCKKLEPTIRKQADACLKIKKQEERSKCFEKIGKTVEPTGCGPFFEPLKQEYMSKEREKYPDQPSAIEGGGGQGGSH